MKVEEILINVDGFSFAAKVWGNESDMPILALHGWLDNANTFDHIAPLLKGVRLICFDAVGHGKSQHRPPRMQYHYLDYVKDAFDIADKLGLEKFGLLGHSMGAAISMFMAGTFPNRITHLACIEALGPPSFPAEQAPEHLAKALLGAKKSNKKKTLLKAMDDAVKARMNGMMQVNEQAAKTLVARGLEKVEEGYVWSTDPRLFFNSAYRFTEEQIHAFLKAIKCPACVIVADNGLFQGKGEWLEERIACVPQMEVHRLAGGHHLHLEEQAETIANILNDFFSLR